MNTAEKVITNIEAGVAAKALIDHFFHNDGPKPDIRIPATEEDTDVVITRYLKQQAARDAAIGELVEKAQAASLRLRRVNELLNIAHEKGLTEGEYDAINQCNQLVAKDLDAAIKAVQG